MTQQSETSEIILNLSDHRAELGKALISAYPNIEALRKMIRDHFKQNPDVVAGEGTLDVKVSNLIDWAIAQSQEKELIEAAYQGNSNNKKLKAITQKLLPSLLENPLYDEQTLTKLPDSGVTKNEKLASDKRSLLRRLRNTLLTSVGLTTFIVALRLFGVFEYSELLLFDQMMRIPPPEKQDDRLLIVQITPKDITHFSKNYTSKNGASLADKVIYDLLNKLIEQKARVIGLDIYRTAKAEKPLDNLINQEKTNNNLVFICKFPNKNKNKNYDPNTTHDPPPDVPMAQVGLSDFLEDNDGVIRRQIIKMGTPNDSETQDLTKCKNSSEELMESFSFKVAQKYLAQENSDKSLLEKENGKLISNQTILKPLEISMQGGYAQKNLNGDQIMINYRYAISDSGKTSLSNIARTFTVKQVLEGKDDIEKFIKDKIVLIGTTAESYDPVSHTPFSKAGPDEAMRGVFIQAQMVSQLVSAVKDNRPLIKVSSLELEFIWILFWSLIGASLPQLCKQPRKLIILGIICMGSLYIIYVALFISPAKFWISFYPSALAFLSTGIMIVFLEFRYQNKNKLEQNSNY